MSRKRRRRKLKKKEIRRNLLIILFVGILACMILLIFRMVTTYEEKMLAEEAEMTSHDSLAENSYDPSGLHMNGQFAAYEDDAYASLQGIDVSSHNGQIDWAEVKNDGIDFAMIRCGYRGYDQGLINEDERFAENYQGAVENGIQTGVYFFSQAVNVEEAAEEADFVIDHLRGKSIDLPVVFDMEIPDAQSRVVALSREEKTRIAVTFMNRIEDAGYQAMIYASSQQMNTVFNLSYLQDYTFWIAEYEAAWPDYAYAFTMWQYSSTGELTGINENVDMDLLFVRKS